MLTPQRSCCDHGIFGLLSWGVEIRKGWVLQDFFLKHLFWKTNKQKKNTCFWTYLLHIFHCNIFFYTNKGCFFFFGTACCGDRELWSRFSQWVNEWRYVLWLRTAFLFVALGVDVESCDPREGKRQSTERNTPVLENNQLFFLLRLTISL